MKKKSEVGAIIRAGIANFAEQFTFHPEIVNCFRRRSHNGYLVCGMGGSQFATELLKRARPALDIDIWRDYRLPAHQDLHRRLVIISSYSGETEETLSAFRVAHQKRLDIAVVSKGGSLLRMARTYRVPYIQIPDTVIPPRLATGFMTRALLHLVGDIRGLAATANLAQTAFPEKFEKPARLLAAKLKGTIPLIYASSKNAALARIRKILINENAKMPSFWNCFPEFNHNEMSSFDLIVPNRSLLAPFHLLLLRDDQDHIRIQKRMNIFTRLSRARGIRSTSIWLDGRNIFERLFYDFIHAQWTSYHLAVESSVDPDTIPIIDKFKHIMDQR